MLCSPIIRLCARPVDAPKYKDFILPLIFLKRLSDVFDEEKDKLSKDYDNKETVDELVEEDHSIVWFYIPQKARWSEIFQQSTKLGEYLTDAVRAIGRENPKLQGVIDIRDYNETARALLGKVGESFVIWVQAPTPIDSSIMVHWDFFV